MSNYELVKETDPILHNPTTRFDFENPQMDPVELKNVLIEFMIQNEGVGLSACQIGIPYAVFSYGDPKNRDSCDAMFNPEIIYRESPEVVQQEGCLSFPHLFVKISRANKIRVRHQDETGETHTKVFTGYTARIVQHEVDHLNGIVFTKRAKKFHLDKALKKRKINQRRQK